MDFTLQGFEKEEAAEIAGRKAMLESPEDDDGFVTVTYKRKRGRNSGNPAESGVAGGGGAGGNKKKRKGAGELTDFYRFQVGHRCFACIFIGKSDSHDLRVDHLYRCYI